MKIERWRKRGMKEEEQRELRSCGEKRGGKWRERERDGREKKREKKKADRTGEICNEERRSGI